jgi:hypothetical protein
VSKTTYTDLGKVTIEKISASGKAVLITRGTGEHWVPLSILESDTATRVIAKAKSVDHFEVADWFIEKEEIEV